MLRNRALTIGLRARLSVCVDPKVGWHGRPAWQFGRCAVGEMGPFLVHSAAAISRVGSIWNVSIMAKEDESRKARPGSRLVTRVYILFRLDTSQITIAGK